MKNLQHMQLKEEEKKHKTHMIKKENSLLFAITTYGKTKWLASHEPAMGISGSVVIPTEEIEQISKPPYLDCGYPFICLRIS
jgi:hypothetical protein